MKFSSLSDKQQKLLKKLYRYRNHSSYQVAGYGNIGEYNSAKALVRKGLAESYLTGFFYITPAGIALIENNK